MGYKEIHLTDALPDEKVNAMKGLSATESDYDILIGGEETRVYKPDGSLLLHLCRGVIPTSVAEGALPFIRKCPSSSNRGVSTGIKDNGKFKEHMPTKAGYSSGTVTTKPIESSIVGYFDRYVRDPFCRTTATTQKHPKEWKGFCRIAKVVDRVFKKCNPEAYAKQRFIADATDPAWLIGKTVFTTVTVNRSWATSYHKDAGDFHEGFGCMAYMETGIITGGILVIPKYRVAVKLQSLDVIMFDVHEWHGNTPITSPRGLGTRITMVMYFREKMVCCGTPEYESERAKYCRDRSKGRLYDPDEMAKRTAIMEKVKKL